MKKKKEIKMGDIILIPIDDTNCGYAQFVEGDKLMGCYIVFDMISNESQCPLDDIIKKPILYMVFTSAFKILNGEWKIIGNTIIPIEVQIPLFKVDVLNNNKINTMVTDYKGNLLRKATEKEKVQLSMMSSYTAVVIENAIKAKYGFIPWQEHYDDLMYKD